MPYILFHSYMKLWINVFTSISETAALFFVLSKLKGRSDRECSGRVERTARLRNGKQMSGHTKKSKPLGHVANPTYLMHSGDSK